MTIDVAHINGYLALWGAVGPMAGIVIGHILTRSWQRTQWKLDNRKEEFRELVTALSETSVESAVFRASLGSVVQQTPDAWINSRKVAYRVIADRIYIALDIEALKVGERFLECSQGMLEHSKSDENMAKLEALMKEIAVLARSG